MTTVVSQGAFPGMHISLYISDPDQTLRFYNAFFGRKPDEVKEGRVKYVFPSPSLTILFIQNPGLVDPHFGNLGFQVETQQEMEEWLARARGLQLIYGEEAGGTGSHVAQDKFQAIDPDGYRWEVCYFPRDTVFNDLRSEDGTAFACCLPLNRAEKKKVRLSELGKPSSPQTPATPGRNQNLNL